MRSAEDIAKEAKVEELTRGLARYERRAWAAEAQIKELTRERDELKRLWQDTETPYDRLTEIRLLTERATTATAQIAALREALRQAKGALRLDSMVDDSGQFFGTTAVALEAIDSTLAATEPAKESE